MNRTASAGMRLGRRDGARAADGAIAWGEAFDETFTNLFRVQDALATFRRAADLDPANGQRRRNLALNDETESAEKAREQRQEQLSEWRVAPTSPTGCGTTSWGHRSLVPSRRIVPREPSQ